MQRANARELETACAVQAALTSSGREEPGGGGAGGGGGAAFGKYHACQQV